MYSIFYKDKETKKEICIHDSKSVSKKYKVLNGTLNLTDNAAGSLEITIPPENTGYDKIERIISEIIVKLNGNEIWSGRVIDEKNDFWNQRVLTCEGELSYLNDTHQTPQEFTDISIENFLEEVFKKHNEHVSPDKQFFMGVITVHETVTCVTKYETTLECINKNVIEKFKGHLVIRKDGEKRYVDYFKDYPNTNTQKIEFGKNLLDFVKNWDMTSYATVILPRGAKLNESSTDEIEDYVTVKSVNGDSIYVTDENAIRERGWIEQIVGFDDITDPSELLTKAKEYIEDTQFEKLTLEISAIDLHYISKDIEPIKLLDQIYCISVPHGLNKIFPVTNMTIPINQPETTKYTLGGNEQTLTSTTNKTNSTIMDKLEDVPNKKSILEAATQNASEIMNQATNGFITIVKKENDNQTITESLLITDTPDYKKATRAWKWNINGLSYYDTDDSDIHPIDYDETSLKVAITMDGAIVADLITTGSMSADIITTGVLKSQNENVMFDLNEGYLTVNSGLISLGEVDATGNHKFQVDDNGYLHAYYGEIGGFTINQDSLFNQTLILNGDGISISHSTVEEIYMVGKIGEGYWKDNEEYRGLTFNLDPKGTYMGWLAKGNSLEDTYTLKLMYTKNQMYDIDYDEENSPYNVFHPDTLNIECDLDCHDYLARRFWIRIERSYKSYDNYNGGFVGGASYIYAHSPGIVKLPVFFENDGRVKSYINVKLINGAILHENYDIPNIIEYTGTTGNTTPMPPSEEA